MARNLNSHEQQIAEPFLNWGMDTVTLLQQLNGLGNNINLIGSGGVRHGLDIARCIRLGAKMTALAQPFLAPALDSTEQVIDKITMLSEQLRWAMFLTGSPDLNSLHTARQSLEFHSSDYNKVDILMRSKLSLRGSECRESEVGARLSGAENR